MAEQHQQGHQTGHAYGRGAHSGPGAANPGAAGVVAPSDAQLRTKPEPYMQPHADQHPEEHEHVDVPIRPLVVMGIGLVVFACVTFVALWGVFRVFEIQSEVEVNNQPASALGPSHRVPPPDKPVLQGVPGLRAHSERTAMEDMREFRARNTELLTAPHPSSGRIPVARAMEQALERQVFKVKLPQKPQAPRPQASEPQPHPTSAEPKPAEGATGGTTPAPGGDADRQKTEDSETAQ